MILLKTPDRIQLVSFWLAISVVIGIGAGLIAALILDGAWFGLAPVLAAVVAASGLLMSRLLAASYTAWARLAERTAGMARTGVMAICYYVVLFAISRTDNALQLQRPDARDGSLWTPLAQGDQSKPSYEAASVEPLRQKWIRGYLRGMFRSGNGWACFLLPFLLLLRLFEYKDESHVPSNIYTLY
ncbi:MAG: hypothetical protein ACR2PS_08895 [Pseudomonadales bacterium]